MQNVFQKCLCKAFGETEYLACVKLCREELLAKDAKDVAVEKRKVYHKMYDILKQKNPETIAKMSEHMTQTLGQAFRIGRQFFSVVVFYIVANCILIGLDLNYTVTCVSLALTGICFLYKLIEFLTNKYCFVDAYLMMVYKAVLEKMTHPLPKL